jgi:hypothetical protein
MIKSNILHYAIPNLLFALISGSDAWTTNSTVYETTFFGKFYARIDAFTNQQGKPMIRYNIDMPANSYIGFGYGKGHDNVDMFALAADSDTVKVLDFYSYGWYKPAQDKQQDYVLTSQLPSTRQNDTKRFNVTCTRLFDTGDKD